MDTQTIISIIFLLVCLLIIGRFTPRMEAYMGHKIRNYAKGKMGAEAYDRLLRDGIVFSRKENYFQQSDLLQNIPTVNPAPYKPDINYGYIFLFVVFIISGLFFVYINRTEEGGFERYFPLIFTLYGTVMLIKWYSTKYFINDKELKIRSGTSKYIIPYEKIEEVEKRTINQGFRHGRKGRIRAETNSKVLLITFFDHDNRKRVIMISPRLQDLFVQNLTYKLMTIK